MKFCKSCQISNDTVTIAERLHHAKQVIIKFLS